MRNFKKRTGLENRQFKKINKTKQAVASLFKNVNKPGVSNKMAVQCALFFIIIKNTTPTIKYT